MTSWSGVAIAMAVVLVGGFLGTPIHMASAPAPKPALPLTSDSIYVAATGNYGYTPDTFNDLPIHANITVTFVDNSTMSGGHTFTILGEQGVQVPNSDTQTQIDALAYGDNPPALLTLNVSGYGVENVSWFQSPGPGWYEFVCTTSSHFQEGMYGFIAFGVNLPSNLTLPNRVEVGGGTLTFSPIDAAVIGALVLALALGYIALRRRRSRLRVPPPSAGTARPASTEIREFEVGPGDRGR